MLKQKDITAMTNAVESDVISYMLAPPRAKRRIERDCYRTFSTYSVKNGGGRRPVFNTDQQHSTKLSHNGVVFNVEETIMYGAPARASGVVNMCSRSTIKCRNGCLQTAGRMKMPYAITARRIRTTFRVAYPYEWAVVVLSEWRNHAERIHAKGADYWVRPNGTTDELFEEYLWLLSMGRDVGVDMFFDYTAHRNRVTPDWYYLAESVKEYQHPLTVTPLQVVVVDTAPKEPLPTVWAGMPVIDGDYEFGDLRPFDRTRPDAVVLLRAKGKLRHVKGTNGGFVKPSIVLTESTTKVKVKV